MEKKEFTDEWISQKLGALPSAVDVRSFEYMKIDERAYAATPAEYLKLTEFMPDNFARSQGNVGTCVGWGWSYCYEAQLTLLLKYLGVSMEIDRVMRSDELKTYLELAVKDMSAGWAYQLSRENSVPPVPDHIEGSTNLGAMRAAAKVGLVSEKTLPTDTTAPFGKFYETGAMLKEAANYRISSYHNVPNHSETLKATMFGAVHELPYKMPDGARGASPLMSAFPVFANFKDAYDDGIVPMPEGRLLGGHSSPQDSWRVIDGKEHWGNFGSWGEDIGDNGKFWIPFDYPFYPNDWWLMKILPTPDPPTPTCIWDDPNWITRVLNWMDNSENTYYYGMDAGGE